MAEPEHTFQILYHFPNEGLYIQAEDSEFNEGVENPTRPDLTKEQVHVLEAQFRAHPKPNSMVKRQLAMQTNLTLPCVANWFQNRRAKAKQQMKQEEFEINQKLAKLPERWRDEAGGSSSPLMIPGTEGASQDRPHLDASPAMEACLTSLQRALLAEKRTEEQDEASRQMSFSHTPWTATETAPNVSRKSDETILPVRMKKDPRQAFKRSGALGASRNINRDATSLEIDANINSSKIFDWSRVASSKPWSVAKHSTEDGFFHIDLEPSDDRTACEDVCDTTIAGSQIRQPAESSPVAFGKEFGSHKGAHSDLAIFENPQMGRERSNSSTDLSTIDSEGERSFVTNIATPRTMSTGNQALFDVLWQKLALKVLKEFLNRSPSTKSATADSSSKSAASQGGRAAPDSASRATQAHTSAAKRSADFRENSEDADEKDDRGNLKRQRRPATSPETGDLLLACPYFKLDPIRYSERNVQEQCYRGCASSLLRNIPRLKQHLYRVHRRPEYYCSRCHATFETQALVDIHNRQRLSCAVSEPQFQERMDNDQMNAIRRRNRRVDVPAEWYSIFKILFPNANLPSSPYADRGSNRAVQNFVSYFRDEAPSVLADLIRDNLDGRLFLDEQTQEILDEAFEHAVSQLILRFQSRLDDLDLSPPLEEPETNQRHLRTSLNQGTQLE